MTKSTLIIFGGLPGTGKTTLAQALSRHLQAVYLRIDTIEQALRNVDALKVGHEGYLAAYAIAADNLRAGNIVIADSVNSIPITREAWRDVAIKNKAKSIEIEVICSDKAEHQRRVEARQADIPGHKMPTWQDVINREYHVWDSRDLLIDTANREPEFLFSDLINKLAKIL